MKFLIEKKKLDDLVNHLNTEKFEVEVQALLTPVSLEVKIIKYGTSTLLFEIEPQPKGKLLAVELIKEKLSWLHKSKKQMIQTLVNDMVTKAGGTVQV